MLLKELISRDSHLDNDDSAEYTATIKFTDGNTLSSTVEITNSENNSIDAPVINEPFNILDHSQSDSVRTASLQSFLRASQNRPRRRAKDNKFYTWEEFKIYYKSCEESYANKKWNESEEINPEELESIFKELMAIISNSENQFISNDIGTIKVPKKTTHQFRRASTDEIRSIDPSIIFELGSDQIYYSQKWVSNPGNDYQENLQQTIRAGQIGSIPPITVSWENGRWVSHDNRRLKALQDEASIAYCRLATRDDFTNSAKKRKDLNGRFEQPRESYTLEWQRIRAV